MLRRFDTDPTARRAAAHAAVFFVVGALGLLPATYGLVMAAFTLVLLPPVLAVYAFGTMLFFETGRYLFGRPLRRVGAGLWTLTALYNGALAAAYTCWGAGHIVYAVERGVLGDAAAPLVAILATVALTLLALHARHTDR